MLSWRAPGIHPRFVRGLRYASAAYEIGNPALRSENSMHAEVTLRHAGERVRAVASFYHHTLIGFIRPVPQAEPTLTVRSALPTFRYAQGNARILGLEATGSARISSVIRTGVAASVLRGTDTERDQPLPRMPADKISGSLTWNGKGFAGLRRPEMGIRVTLVRKQHREPPESVFLPAPDGFGRVDLDMAATLDRVLKGTEVALTIGNLLDATYREYLSTYRYVADEPGRSVWLRLYVPIGGGPHV
jgi:iron complex outermembrane receptor protein